MEQVGDSRETELQILLRDERDRCNQHRQIYETLKEKHAKLQNELILIYDQLKEATSLSEKQKSSYEATARKLQSQVKDQQREIACLISKLKAVDEKKIKTAAFQEASTHYEAKIKELHSESDKVRDEYNNLHYENAILKCKFESREAEYSRSVERIHLQHHSEIELLKNKLEDLEKKQSAPLETYAIELKSCKREVLQLNSKIRTLLSECDELRAENENLSVQLSSMHRTNSKLISDHTTNIRILESEKLKATAQIEILEKELSNAQEYRKVLNNELQASKRTVLSLKSKMEDSEHQCRLTVSNLQLDMEQWKVSKESEGEQFIQQIANLKIELHSLSADLNKERQSLVLKEQELEQSLSNAKQQLWKQARELAAEREKFEHKLKESELEHNEIVSRLNVEIHVLKQKLETCLYSKADVEKELVTIKGQSGDSENQFYQKEIQELREKIELLSAGGILTDREGKRINVPNEVTQMKLTWEQQKLQLHQRLDELESQLRDSRSTFSAEKQDLEFKIKQYVRQVGKLKERLEFQKTQNEDLEFQKDILDKYVPPEVHLQVKSQLHELMNKLENYRALITADPNSSSRAAVSVPFNEKLLMDIKNIQQQSALPSQVSFDRTAFNSSAKESSSKLSPKKQYLHRRKSLKSRERRSQTKVFNPTISSSSDLELENL